MHKIYHSMQKALQIQEGKIVYTNREHQEGER